MTFLENSWVHSQSRHKTVRDSLVKNTGWKATVDGWKLECLLLLEKFRNELKDILTHQGHSTLNDLVINVFFCVCFL